MITLASAAAILLAKAYDPGAAAQLDVLAGWPTTALATLFAMKFPEWYWKRNWSKMAPVPEVDGEPASG